MTENVQPNEILTGPADPEAAARAAVDSWLASKKGAAPAAASPALAAAAPAPAPAPKPAVESSEPAWSPDASPDSHESWLRAVVGAEFDAPFTKASEEASLSVLRAKWGDDTDKNLATVQALTKRLGDGFRSYLDETGRGNDARTIEALYDYAIAQQDSPTTGEPVPLTLPVGLPATQVPDDYQEQMSEYSSAASAAGLDARTQQRLLDVMVADSLDFPVSEQLDHEDAAVVMEQRWGADYQRRVSVVKRTVAKLGPAMAQYLATSNRGNDPATLEALYQYGSGNLSITPAEAQKRLDKIYADPKHAYWRPGSTSERKRVTAEVRLLSAIANEASAPVTAPRRGADAVAEMRAKEQGTASASARAEAAKLLADTKNFTAGPASEMATKKARFISLTAKI